MALLQISEPGQASAPHQHKLAIGIDLGTTNSLVASVQSGQSKVLTDENNKAILPSVAIFHQVIRTIFKGFNLLITQTHKALNRYNHGKFICCGNFSNNPNLT
jgi:molecular chaperone DnaK (HSP70)